MLRAGKSLGSSRVCHGCAMRGGCIETVRSSSSSGNRLEMAIAPARRRRHTQVAGLEAGAARGGGGGGGRPASVSGGQSTRRHPCASESCVVVSASASRRQCPHHPGPTMDTDPHDLRAPRKTGSGMKVQEEEVRPRPAVCRRLFSDAPWHRDDGSLENMFNQIYEESARNLEEAKKRYNFDFHTEEPLEGDWTWERITPETPSVPDSAPAALAEPPVREDTPTDPEESPSSDLRHPSVPQ